MTEAIFGLIGVLVGGVLQGGTTWWIERRRESWAARRAGRLLTHDLKRLRFLMTYASEQPLPWGFLGHQIRNGLANWPEHAAVLAGTIHENDMWQDIVTAVDSLERTEQRSHASPDDNIGPEDQARAAEVAEELWAAAMTASLIGVAGIQMGPRRLLRKATSRFRRHKLEEQTQRVLDYSYRVDGEEPPSSDDAGSVTPR
jgi:hypothetical protein